MTPAPVLHLRRTAVIAVLAAAAWGGFACLFLLARAAWEAL